jgi:gamma-glutamylcyclotransferase (GGCT)/AIG2-like uncharacterized protein YtfP
VYGTLMVPRVMYGVCGHDGPGVPATLHGYRRRRLHGEHYPGIRPCAGDNVQGVLYGNVSAAQLGSLDAFEGDWYLRQAVPVETGAGRTQAQVYVLAPTWEHLMSPEHWSLEHFLRHGLESFIADYRGFAAVPGGESP